MSNEDQFEGLGGSSRGVGITQVNQYKFVSDAYTGGGGFKDGSYLLSYACEDQNYAKRRQEVSYKNYLKGIVDSLIIPVFSSPAVRETNSVLFQAFLSNVTAGGVAMQDFVKSVITHTRLHGVSFIIMDNYATLPLTVKEAIDTRVYPYAYEKTASEYSDATLDKFGNIISITFFNGKVEIKKGVEVETTITFTNNSVILAEVNGKALKTVPHNLGVVPVIPVKIDATGSLQPTPPVYSLATLSYVIFQQGSEQRNTERQSAFSMLTMPGVESQSQISVGSDSVLWYDPTSSSSPSYIGPDAGVLTALMATQAANVNDLLAQADVIGASAVQKSAAESGIAKAYSFAGQHWALKETASLAESVELMMAAMFFKFVGEANSTYTVDYQDNYAPGFAEVSAKFDLLAKMASFPGLQPEALAMITASVVELYELTY